MPGGEFDSSKTRVAPLFDRLLEKDHTGQSWLPRLLSLPEHGSGVRPPSQCGPLRACGWGDKERALQPPVALLAWLIRNLAQPIQPDTSSAWSKRQQLIARNPAVTEEAMRLLRSDPSNRAWHVMEGPSYPDAFLATDDLVVVIEGKRTEAGPTTSTTWMPVRHQMLRHLDGALEILAGRSLYGLFLVEGNPDGALPGIWREACVSTLTSEALDGSLPHRGPGDRLLIRDAFLGATTWRVVCRALEVPLESLPERVAS